MSAGREHARRVVYRASSRQEAFNVPLLGAAVEEAIETHAQGGAGQSVLDAGCGGQPLRSMLESRGYRYSGLDIIAQPGVTLDFQLAIDEPWPESIVGHEGYDLVLCTEVLEHVHGWPAAWRNLARAVKPGGTLIVTCPFFYPLHEIPHDHWRPTEFAIRQAADAAGLQVIEFKRLGDAWDVLGTLAGTAVPRRNAGILAWPLTLATRFMRNVIWVLCRSRLLRRSVALRTELYLGNFAVLKRPVA